VRTGLPPGARLRAAHTRITLGRRDGAGPLPLVKIGDFPPWSSHEVPAMVEPRSLRTNGIPFALVLEPQAPGDHYIDCILSGGP
jgi:hypothetical protein